MLEVNIWKIALWAMIKKKKKNLMHIKSNMKLQLFYYKLLTLLKNGRQLIKKKNNYLYNPNVYRTQMDV